MRRAIASGVVTAAVLVGALGVPVRAAHAIPSHRPWIGRCSTFQWFYFGPAICTALLIYDD